MPTIERVRPMPSPAEAVEAVLRFVGEVLSASSLRFGVGPTLAVLGVLLVFLQLVARPVSRWVSSDPGGLAGIGRAMAIAAEAGSDVVVSIGSAGIARSTDALGRLQTLAAMPIVGHVARAAARSGVPLRVLTNDPLAGIVAASALDAAHVATATEERAARSRIVVVGEGRPVMGGLVLTARAQPAAAIAAGSLREEAQLHLEGLRGGAGALSAATAEPSQAPTTLLAAPNGLVGPELFHAAADLRASVDERTAVAAANRLVLLGIALVVLGTLLALAGVVDIAPFLAGVDAG
jgi:hypothetical protein